MLYVLVFTDAVSNN